MSHISGKLVIRISEQRSIFDQNFSGIQVGVMSSEMRTRWVEVRRDLGAQDGGDTPGCPRRLRMFRRLHRGVQEMFLV